MSIKSLPIILLILSLLLVPATSRSAPPAPDATQTVYWQQELAQPHAPGELLVQMRASAGATAQAISAPVALSAAQHIETISDLNLQRYRVNGNLAATLAQLNADPNIVFAEPNYLLQPDFEPDDPIYVHYAGNPAGNGGYLTRMNMPAAWDMELGHHHVIVAVIDSGVDLDHEDMKAALWKNPDEIPDNDIDDDENGLIDDIYGWNFAADEADVNDWHGHGSHVAGIIGARINNGIGMAGVSPQARIMALGVFSPPGYGTYADEVKAVLYATDHGAKVINLSLGSTAYSRGEQMAIEYAVRRGVVVVAAAGNDGREVHHWPAAHEAAIAVTAVNSVDQRAGWSNMGTFVDVAAAGVSIQSLSKNGSYTWKSGTSMSSPHVAGVAALILSRNPTLSPIEVKTILESSAHDLGAAGWDKLHGHGRVDAEAALQATTPFTGTFPPLTPDWLQQRIWPEFCTEQVENGGFEADISANWVLTGTAEITSSVSYTGSQSLYLVGEPGQQGVAYQNLSIPPDLHSATLAFALRADNEDTNLGSDPTTPGRDHLRAWFLTAEGAPLLELARIGNANAPLGASLAWDRTLHVLSEAEIDLLRGAGEVQLWFSGSNGPDPQRTRFYVDDVRLCTTHRPQYLPLVMK